MGDFKHSDMRIVEQAFQMDAGFVLNFSDRTFAEFFEDEFRIHIDDAKYLANGTSKMNRLRTFVKLEDPATVAKVLRGLWQHRVDNLPHLPLDIEPRLFGLIARLEGGAEVARTDAIERFASDPTLDELVAAIERDILANAPDGALDRLHTYCSKKFGHLLDVRGIAWDRSEPLHSRVGKYVKALKQEVELREMTEQIIKGAFGVFDKFNHVRNNASLAHDNDLVDKAEARFIFDSVSVFLRFIKSVDAVRFGG